MRLDAMVDYGPVCPGRVTWARPRRVSASDGNFYVVKIRNGDNGSKSFFNEFVASNMALMAGLPAAEPVIIHLGAEFIETTEDLRNGQIEPGAYFATQYYSEAYAIGDGPGLLIRPSSIVNICDVPAFVVFDIFVHNKDRHGGNTMLIPQDGGRTRYRYLLIDHGHCFGGPAWSADSVSDLPYELSGVPWHTDAIAGESDFVGPATRMALLGEPEIDAARDGLPDEWDVPIADYKALKNSMTSRRRGKMMGAVRAGMSIIAAHQGAAGSRRGA